MDAERQVVIGGEGQGPVRRGERHGSAHVARLEQDGLPHGFGVGLRGCKGFAELILAFAPHAIFCSGGVAHRPVSRRIDEHRGAENDGRFRTDTPAGDRLDAWAFHRDIVCFGIGPEDDVLFALHVLLQQQAPVAVPALVKSGQGFELKLFQQTGLPSKAVGVVRRAVDALAVAAATEFAAGRPAQNGAVVHQPGTEPFAGGGDGGKGARDATANHSQVKIVFAGETGQVMLCFHDRGLVRWSSSAAGGCGRDSVP